MTQPTLDPQGVRRPFWSFGLLCTLVFAPGCRSAPPGPAPPLALVPEGLESTARLASGSVITARNPTADLGPVPTASGTAASGTAVGAHVILMAIERRPSGPGETGPVGDALSALTRLAVDDDVADPILTTSRLASGAQIVRGTPARELVNAIEGGDWGRFETVADTSAALGEVAGGVGLLVAARATETPAEPENFLREYAELGPVTRSLTLLVSRDIAAAEPFVLGFLLEGTTRPHVSGLAPEPVRGERPPDALHPLGERVVLSLPPRVGEPIAVLFEAPFETGAASAWVAWLELLPAEEPLPPERLPYSHGPTKRDPETEAPALASVLSALIDSENPRAALAFLAQSDGPSLAEELALFADDALVGELLAEALAALEQGTSPDGDPLVDPRRPWLVERATYLRLTKTMVEAQLTSAVDAALLRHTGEAGRYPSTVESAARASLDRPAFERALVEENLIFLADRNPGARVRAFDWLTARGAAPPFFEPLAPEDERRAALEARRVGEDAQ